MKFEKTPWNVMFRALKNLKVMGGDAFGGQNKLKSNTLRIFQFFACKSANVDSASLPLRFSVCFTNRHAGFDEKALCRGGLDLVRKC